MPAFPVLDLTRLDLTRLDLTRLSELTLPDVKLPEMKLPQVELPQVKLPDVDTGQVADRVEQAVEQVAGYARDAAYVGIGLGVLTVQQAQVRRREFQRAVSTRVQQLTER